MTAEIMINKVVITEEAKFDYEEVVVRQPIPKTAIKNECELYIDNLQKGGRLLNGYYFRAKYYDENSDKMLMLFFYKGERFGKMQLWQLSGICEADDWTEEQEDDGQIRNWLKSKIDLTGIVKTDWVLELREAQKRGELGEMPCFRLMGLPKEVSDAIYNGTDKEISERLSQYKGKVESGSATTDICQSLESLEKCVSVLDEESYTIITSLFFEKVSASRLVNRLNRSRSGLYLRVNIIAQMLAKAMSEIV